MTETCKICKREFITKTAFNTHKWGCLKNYSIKPETIPSYRGNKILSKQRIIDILISQSIDKSIIDTIRTRTMKNHMICKHDDVDQLSKNFLICFDCGLVYDVA